MNSFDNKPSTHQSSKINLTQIGTNDKREIGDIFSPLSNRLNNADQSPYNFINKQPLKIESTFTNYTKRQQQPLNRKPII